MSDVSPAPVYLDWNATTPLCAEAREAMEAALREGWANPSSVHGAGRRARALVEEAREVVAELLCAEARDVLFTSGGTEANNLALSGAPALVTSRLEHPSVVRVAEALEAAGRPVAWLPVPEAGCIEPAAVEAALEQLPRGAFVALMAANHETGVVQPVAEVAEVVRRHGAHLHVDAVQAVGKVAGPWAAAQSVAVAAHKIRGPKGIGALVWRGAGPPAPVLRGGAQERGLRPGTLDPVAAAGFGAAARRAIDGSEPYARLAPLRDRFEAAVHPWVTINGAGAPRLPHVSNVSVAGWRGDELVAALDLHGVCVSSGSACSAGTAEPSPVIAAMVGEARSRSAVRMSLGDVTLREELERAIHSFIRVVTGHGPRS